MYDIENGKRLAEAARKAMEGVWLIEMNEPAENKPPAPRWWHPEHGWMWDANKALRFSREVDALDYLRHGKGIGQHFISGKATEHVFLDQHARSGVPALAADLELAHAEIARLREGLGDAREDLMWSAYAMGVEKDGRWSHLHMSDGEWLARELGLDCKLYDYDAAAVKEAIPIKARALLGETP